MVKDADDQNLLILNRIENAMLPMRKAPIGFAISGRSDASLGMVLQQAE